MSTAVSAEVGMRFAIEGNNYELVRIDESKSVHKAEMSSDQYREMLLRRPLNRYMPGALQIAEHKRGDLITEEWTVLLLKAVKAQVQVYTKYEVRKGEE